MANWLILENLLVLKGNKSKILYFAGTYYGIITIPKKKEANKPFLFPSRGWVIILLQ